MKKDTDHGEPHFLLKVLLCHILDHWEQPGRLVGQGEARSWSLKQYTHELMSI